MRPSRLALTALAGSLVLLSAACGQGSNAPTSPASTSFPGVPTYEFNGGGESLVALFDVHVDPVALTATATPRAGRRAEAQPPQALSYDLDIANFLQPDSFELSSVTTDADGDLEVGFIHRHPFRAPDFTAAITGTNRADLSYTGRLLILADRTSSSFFTSGVTLDPTLVKGADGYVSPGNLLATVGLTNNTFPFILLADDGEDNRVDESNGGSPTGNYVAATGGWQRANAGTNNTSWTGYDYMHGGQEAKNTFTLRSAALASGIDLAVAIVIKYTDPRGIGGRTMRFPPATADVSQFAYRLPYAALDCSQSAVTTGDVVIQDTIGSVETLSLAVRDWDKDGVPAADADLSDESDVSLIEPGAAGAPTVDLDAPDLNAAPATFTLNGTNTGLPGDELVFDGTLANSLGTATPGDYYGCVRMTDPSDATNDDAYHFGVDPATIVPDPARAIDSVYYQVVPFEVEIGLIPPVVTAVTPLSGSPSSNVNFNLTQTGDPATSWAWDFGTWGTPTTSTLESPIIGVPAVAGPYNGSVTATNAAGTSAPFNFTFSVANPWPPVPPAPPEPGAPGDLAGWFPKITVYNGNPAIAAFIWTGGNTRIKMYIGNIAEPLVPADWTIYDIPATQFPGTVGDTGLSLVNYGGRLIMLYKNDSIDDLIFGAATVVAPAVPTATDWTFHTVDSVGDVGRDNRLVVHNNLLAVGYRDTTNQDLKVAQSLIALPTATADWAIHTVDGLGFNTGVFTGLVSYDDGVSGPRLWASSFMITPSYSCRISRATVLTPASSADWVNMDVDTAGGAGRWTCLTTCTIAGQPRVAASYSHFISGGVDVAIATSATPSLGTDWNVISNVNPVPQSSIGSWGTEIKEIQGRLVVAWNQNPVSGNDTLVLARANSDNPLTPADWTVETVAATPGVDTGFYPTMTLLSTNKLGIAWRHGTNFTSNPGLLYYASRAYSY